MVYTADPGENLAGKVQTVTYHQYLRCIESWNWQFNVWTCNSISIFSVQESFYSLKRLLCFGTMVLKYCLALSVILLQFDFNSCNVPFSLEYAFHLNMLFTWSFMYQGKSRNVYAPNFREQLWKILGLSKMFLAKNVLGRFLPQLIKLWIHKRN